MNIQIKKNTFVEPGQSRQYVVQGICDAIMRKLFVLQYSYYEIGISGEYPELFFGEYKGKYPENWSPKTISKNKNTSDYDYTRIRTCEMRLAFRLLQDAGYYVFWDEYHLRYIVSTRPYFCTKRIEYTEFRHYID